MSDMMVGRVINSTKDNFVVETYHKQKWQILKTKELFLNVRIGDGIQFANYTQLQTTQGGIDKSLMLKDKPYVIVGVGEEAIRNCLRNAHKSRIEKYVELFGTDGIKLSRLAQNWKRFNQPELLKPYDEHLHVQLKELLKNWYKDVLLRQLHLFGFKNEDIKRCRLQPIELKKQIDVNPFALIGIPDGMCYGLWRQQFKTLNNRQYAAIAIYRRMVKYLREESWTSIPLTVMVAQFPNIAEHLETLTDELYKVRSENDCLYLDKPHEIETFLVGEFVRRLKKSPRQRENITTKSICKELLMCVQGAAGCGKTTNLKKVVAEYDREGKTLLGVTLSGKARERMMESMGRNCMTIHMAITMKDMVKFDGVAMDEATMTSNELMYDFLRAFPGDYPIYFSGDIAQLRPIDWGNMFEQLLKSKVIPILTLTHNYRLKNQNLDENTLFYNLQQIREGKTDLKAADDFIIMESKTSKDVISNTIGMIKSLRDSLDIGPRDLTVITPRNAEVDIFNRYIQQLFHPDENVKGALRDSSGKLWFVGDEVICTDNNYSVGINNGSRGTITAIEGSLITVTFRSIDAREVKGEGEKKIETKETQLVVKFTAVHTVKEVDEYEERKKKKTKKIDDETDDGDATDILSTEILQLAYALTTHKMQGSQSDFIIFALDPEIELNEKFMNRNLVYTAFSRAAVAAIYVGQQTLLEMYIRRIPPPVHDNMINRIDSFFI